MNFKDLVMQRESCRSYDKEKKVTEEDMLEIIETAMMAPSACNSQPWHFVLIQGEMSKHMPKLLQFDGLNKFADDISTFVIVCETEAKLLKHMECNSQRFAQMDIGSAFSHLTLSASDKGISSCIMGCFDEAGLRQTYSITDKIRVVVGFGYSATEKPRKKARKQLESILTIIKD